MSENNVHYMYLQIVEKIEYQNREAAKHDTELKKGVFKLQADIQKGLASNRHELHTLVKLTKAIIVMQVMNLSVTSDTLPALIKMIL